jgi:hypothetical protein
MLKTNAWMATLNPKAQCNILNEEFTIAMQKRQPPNYNKSTKLSTPESLPKFLSILPALKDKDSCFERATPGPGHQGVYNKKISPKNRSTVAFFLHAAKRNMVKFYPT